MNAWWEREFEGQLCWLTTLLKGEDIQIYIITQIRQRQSEISKSQKIRACRRPFGFVYNFVEGKRHRCRFNDTDRQTKSIEGGDMHVDRKR